MCGVREGLAGGIPLVALTAWQALESAGLREGQRVLVTAGAGGVGHFAVQLAKVHWGAYVVATAGPSNQAFLKVLFCLSTRRSLLFPVVLFVCCCLIFPVVLFAAI